jgi:hypothetical protein
MKHSIRNLLLLSALLSQPLVYAGSIENVLLPSTIGNRAVVPFKVSFNPPLEKGEAFYVITDEDKYALKVTTEGNTTASEVSARFKALTNEVQFIIVKDGKTISQRNLSFQNTDNRVIGIIEKTNKPLAACRYMPVQNEFKILCRSAMSKNEYINKAILTNPNGNVVIQTTPYISQNPYFGVVGNFNPKDLGVKIYTSSDEYQNNNSLEKNGSREISDVRLHVNGNGSNSNNSNWTKAN